MKKVLIFCLSLFIFLVIYFKTNWIHNESTGLKDLKNYRIGDAILDESFNWYIIRALYRNYFKGTIGGEYFTRTSKSRDYDTLYKIIKEKTQNLEEIPKEDEAVFHIRAGDVIDWEYSDDIDDLLEGRKHYDYKKCKIKDYLLNYKKIDDKLNLLENISKVTMVSGYHTNEDHTRSEIYLSKIKKFLEGKGLQVSQRINSSADDDFLYMSNSKFFMKSGGRFSELIGEMVKKNNNLVF